MSRILKALLKTILCIMAIVLFIILANCFPYAISGIIILAVFICLFISFYNKED